jgi:hypothetical protein
MVKTPVGKFCTFDCATEYARTPTPTKLDRVKKLEKKEDFLRKKLFQASDLKLRRVSAQTAFNAFIRERDSKLSCISCERYHSGQYHAGHFKTTAARSDIKFNEDNCHKQCAPCNNHLSGNIEHYRPNLIKKIGLDRVEALDVQRIVKWTCEMYKEIEATYKRKLAEMTKHQK